MPVPKKYYLVVGCTGCGRFLLATSDKRSRTCPYCGKRVLLNAAQIIGRSSDAEEARSILQDVKTRKHSGRTAENRSPKVSE